MSEWTEQDLAPLIARIQQIIRDLTDVSEGRR